jgi:adenylate cyclase
MFRLTALFLAGVLYTSISFAGNPSHLLGKPYNIQFLWLDSVRHQSNMLDSATAMSFFENLERWSAPEDKQFSHGVRLIRYRWLNDHRLNLNALDQMYSDLLSTVEQTKFNELRTDVLFHYAEHLWGRSSYSKALEHYIHAYNLALALPYGSYPLIGELIYQLGGKYYHFRDFETASKYFSLYWRQVPPQYQTEHASKFNTVALAFNYMQSYDSALYYFDLAEQEAKKTNDKFWIALISGNKGYCYFLQGKYDEAIPLFEHEIQQNGRTMEAANSMVNLGAIYLMRGQKEKAHQLELEAYSIFKEQGYTNNFNIIRTSYPHIAASYASVGDYTNAFRFADSARLAADTVNRRRNMLYISGVQHKIEAEQHMRDLQVKETELGMQRSQRNWLLAGLGSLVVFIFIILQQKKRIAKEKKRSDDLLRNILPEETAEELKQTGSAKAKNYDMVTVLFTDFQNFTIASEKMTAEELVGEINYCYSEFDKILSKYGVEKIKTIGDSYMCAGGLPTESKTHAEDVVAVAVEIVDFMEKETERRKAEGRSYFSMRLGIHTGPVVAGIVGIKKFAYDIWGDTVNIASRMESSGEPGRINISENTYERIKHKYNCTYRGEVEAKNKGKLKMYFLEQRIEDEVVERFPENQAQAVS